MQIQSSGKSLTAKHKHSISRVLIALVCLVLIAVAGALHFYKYMYHTNCLHIAENATDIDFLSALDADYPGISARAYNHYTNGKKTAQLNLYFSSENLSCKAACRIFESARNALLSPEISTEFRNCGFWDVGDPIILRVSEGIKGSPSYYFGCGVELNTGSGGYFIEYENDGYTTWSCARELWLKKGNPYNGKTCSGITRFTVSISDSGVVDYYEYNSVEYQSLNVFDKAFSSEPYTFDKFN